MKLNQSEQAVLSLIARDRYFTTDPGQRQRLNNAAYSLVKKGVCEVTHRRTVWEEHRRSVGGGYIETSRVPYGTIRIAPVAQYSKAVGQLGQLLHGNR
jgi:hypothetical protein